MFWKNWPYWLRGGVIGGGVTLIWLVVARSCEFVGGDYSCMTAFILSPMYPVVMLIDNYSELSLEVLTLISVGAWSVVGLLIGSLVGFIKSRMNISRT